MSFTFRERELAVNTYAVTRFYGPTNHRGARIYVTTSGMGRRVIAYDYAARCAHESAIREVFGPSAVIERDFDGGNGRGYGFTVDLPESF